MLLGDLLGQPRAQRALERAVAEDGVASAYLFDGPGGVGKTLAAVALAKAMNCDARPGVGCGACGPCKRIDAGQHPDVRIFAPREEGAGNIAVEFVREEILPFARYAPFEAKVAVAVFPSADVSFPAGHAEAANALLKTLEEPRPRLVFILASERPERLLPTIRSRCQRIPFSRLSNDEVDALLEARGVDVKVREVVVPLAGGRMDTALTLVEDEGASDVLALALRVDETLRTRGPGALVALSEEIVKREDVERVLTTLSLLYRDAVALALEPDDAELFFPAARAELEAWAERLDVGALALRSDRLRGLLDGAERNANLGMSLDALLLELHGTEPRSAQRPPAP